MNWSIVRVIKGWRGVSSERRRSSCSSSGQVCVYMFSMYFKFWFTGHLTSGIRSVGPPAYCPIFWRRRAPYFSQNLSNSLDPIHGRQFSRNLLTAIAFVPVRRRQFFTKSTLAYLSMRAGTHAVRWSRTLGGPLTPPLCHRVGSS